MDVVTDALWMWLPMYLSLQWLVLRFGMFNFEVIQAAIRIAKQEGLSVSMDLASFEVYLLKPFRIFLLFDATGCVFNVCSGLLCY